MKSIFKNPYKTNFLIFGFIAIGTLIYLISAAKYHSSVFGWSDYAMAIFNDIIIGIFTTSLLLLGIEWMHYTRDKRRLGYLEGTYRKILITGVNDERKRTEDILLETREKTSKGSNIKYINGSIYHELCYYEIDKNEYLTTLFYEYNGKYTGTVEYIDHDFKYDKDKGHAQMDIKPKCKAAFSLIFNPPNTGSGNYKYEGKYDFGTYNFQIDPENENKVLVFHQNTIPSGLAEGYEIWERV